MKNCIYDLLCFECLGLKKRQASFNSCLREKLQRESCSKAQNNCMGCRYFVDIGDGERYDSPKVLEELVEDKQVLEELFR